MFKKKLSKLLVSFVVVGSLLTTNIYGVVDLSNKVEASIKKTTTKNPVTKKTVTKKPVTKKPVKVVKKPATPIKKPTTPVQSQKPPVQKPTTPIQDNYKVATDFSKSKVIGEYKGFEIYGYGTLDYEIVKGILDADWDNKSELVIKLKGDAYNELSNLAKSKVEGNLVNDFNKKYVSKLFDNNLFKYRLLSVLENNYYLPKFKRYTYQFFSENKEVVLTLYFDSNKAFRKEDLSKLKANLDEIVSKIKEQKPANDFEKHLYIMSYIYTSFYGEDGTYRSHSAYGILVDRVNGVCESLVKAYAYIARELGIDSYMLVDNSGNHAYNLVKLEGNYYIADTTLYFGRYYDYVSEDSNKVYVKDDISVSTYLDLRLQPTGYVVYPNTDVSLEDTPLAYYHGSHFVYGWGSFDPKSQNNKERVFNLLTTNLFNKNKNYDIFKYSHAVKEVH